MMFYDFEYDGINLSNKGFIICKFDSGGIETVSNGSNITFNTVSTRNGAKHELVSSVYEECLTTTFQICKHPCLTKRKDISIVELRDIMRWLNRKEFYKLKFIHDEYMNIFFEASFNVKKIEYCGKVYGLELEVITNKPYALHEPIYHTIKNEMANGKKSISNVSDEDGYIYPKMEIEISEDGDFELFNAFENRTMRILNCKAGEIINIDYPIIESSNQLHKIQNDFNWKFFRISKSINKRVNDLIISIPCIIKLKYCPVVKIGF
ncbi:MAG: hypothetical protein IJZ77_03060 [Bacilli bacterium]|nr:hypothetical protein [Bacilli bacterium]